MSPRVCVRVLFALCMSEGHATTSNASASGARSSKEVLQVTHATASDASASGARSSKEVLQAQEVSKVAGQVEVTREVEVPGGGGVSEEVGLMEEDHKIPEPKLPTDPLLIADILEKATQAALVPTAAEEAHQQMGKREGGSW